MDPATAAPFYENWIFWSFVVATIALVLSQLPPLWQLLRPAKLVLEVLGRILVTHKVGHPNLGLYVSIRNEGGRQARIKSISASVTREGQAPSNLLAITYYVGSSDTNAVLLIPFIVRPDEDWAHMVNFLEPWRSRADERAYRQLESNLRADIHAKLPLRADSNQVVEADRENVDPLLQWFEQHFPWLPGEYQLSVSVVAEPAHASKTRRLRFTLFESDTKDLRAYADDFKYGAGIYFDTPKHAPLNVPVSEA